MTAADTPRYWFCVVGPIPDDKLPYDADLPPRLAARQAIENMTGYETHRCTASGWVDASKINAAMRKARVQCALEANKE